MQRLSSARGFLGRMFAESFFGFVGRRDGPNAFHLFAVVLGFHGFVMKRVFGLFIFLGPQQGFGGMGKEAARQIGRRVGFFPSNVVQNVIADACMR